MGLGRSWVTLRLTVCTTTDCMATLSLNISSTSRPCAVLQVGADGTGDLDGCKYQYSKYLGSVCPRNHYLISKTDP